MSVNRAMIRKKIVPAILGVSFVLLLIIILRGASDFPDISEETRVELPSAQREDITSDQEEDAEVPYRDREIRPGAYGVGTEDDDVFTYRGSPSIEEAVLAKDQLLSYLPIYVEEFKTSVGITTTINVFTVSGDLNYVTRLEIYGVSYLDRSVDPVKNPSATAYKESFEHALEKIEETGVDPKKLLFIFYTRKHANDTASYWVNSFGLL